MHQGLDHTINVSISIALICLSITVLVASVPSAIFAATASQWWVFADLDTGARPVAVAIFGTIALFAAVVLGLGIRFIGDLRTQRRLKARRR